MMSISDSICYIGADDVSARLFESQYPLEHGMSYNSYLIKDEKTAILDTIDRHCADVWLHNLEAALGGTRPDYLIIHHLEPDHSALIGKVLGLYPDITLVLSARAAAMLPQFIDNMPGASQIIAVNEGDSLDLGRHKLKFFMAPMIHWPEVMMTYESTERVFFSADAFGKFGALGYEDSWADEARRYYINIVGKYGRQVSSLLKRVNPYPVSHIAPLHGPVLSGDLTPYLRLYDLWSTYRPENERGVLIAFASIYGHTAEAAAEAAALLRDKYGVDDVTVMDLCRNDMSEAVAQAFRTGRMILACATYDGGMFPVMSTFIEHIAMKGYRSRRVALIDNGSWAPVAGKLMRKALEALPDISFAEPSPSLRTRLTDTDRRAIDAMCADLMK